MTAAAEAHPTNVPHPLIGWLRDELRPTEGRGAAVGRIVLNCTITVVVAMVFQIPLPAYMAYMVFLVSREQRVGTLITAVGGAIAATLAVGLSLAFYTVDASEPAVRLPLMALSTFVGIFLSRTTAIGPIAFLAGFVLVLTQTLVDGVSSLEVLTHLVLWLWVIVVFPAALTTLVDLAFGRDPMKLVIEHALRVLDSGIAVLNGSRLVDFDRLEAGTLEMLELRRHAAMADKLLRPTSNIDHRIVEILTELLELLRVFPDHIPREASARLVQMFRHSRQELAVSDAPTAAQQPFTNALLADLTPDARPVVTAIANAVARLSDELVHRRAAPIAEEVHTPASFFVADAWTNREHVRFALKTTIAVMASYLIYTLLDWPGIRTAVVTCFFVALGSLGETVHKSILRIGGALIGGFAAALCIVYALPHMTDIGQLVLLIAAFTVLSAWVATSSELLSYAGMQMAFAFFLGILQDYGPTTELTGLRDRIVGILLGNVLMLIVFSTIWPTSALDRARAAMGRALRGIADLIENSAHPATGARLAVVQAVVEARRFSSLTIFEVKSLKGRPNDERVGDFTVTQLSQLCAIAFVMAGQSISSEGRGASRNFDVAATEWFSEAARRLDAGDALPSAPDTASFELVKALTEESATATLRAELEARLLLQREMEHVRGPPA